MSEAASLFGQEKTAQGYLTEKHSQMHGRVLGVWENVKAWGAIGDGTTNDTDAFVNALAALPVLSTDSFDVAPSTSKGGTVYVPPGVYLVDPDAITLSSAQRIVGAGKRASVIKVTGTGKGITIGNGTSFNFAVLLQGFTLYMPSGGLSAGAHGVHSTRLFNSRIHDIEVWGAKDNGINLDGVSLSRVTHCDIQQCWSHGIYIDADDPPDHATATILRDNTVRVNNKSGIYLDGVSDCVIKDNTLESNGAVGNKLGFPGSGGVESGLRSINLTIQGGFANLITGNYFEQSAAYSNMTQIGICSGDTNQFRDNRFINYVGMYWWSDGTGSPIRYKTQHNIFDASNSPNMVTARDAAATLVNGNYFEGNVGMNWSDQDSNYAANIVVADSSADGLKNRYITVAGGTGYSPDGGLTTGGVDPSIIGFRKARTFEITLDQNFTVNAPTNFGDADELRFVIKQNGTGGFTVAWDAVFKMEAWSETGNTANKISVIRFIKDDSGNVWYQSGKQVGYY